MIEFIQTHYGDVCAGILALLALLKIIASFTKTKKDDAIVSKAQAWFLKIIGFFKKEEKKDGDTKPDSK